MSCRLRACTHAKQTTFNFKTDSTLLDVLEITKNSTNELKAYITQAITQTDVPPQSTLEGITESIVSQGLATLNYSGDVLDAAKQGIEQLGPIPELSTVEGRTVFSQFKNKPQKSVELLKVLRTTGILNDNVLGAIDAYVNKNDEDDEVVCYSHLAIRYLNNDTPQKLHRDHFADDIRQEVIFAVDLSGSPLVTRVFTNTHLGSKLDRSYCSAIRVLQTDPLAANYGPFEDIRRPAPVKCQALRLLSTMISNLSSGKYMTYTEVQTPAMLFDAGSFHSGGLPELNTLRLFLTFRSKHFYDNGSGLDLEEDTWFADKQPWVPVRNILNGTFTSLQKEEKSNKKQRTRTLDFNL